MLILMLYSITQISILYFHLGMHMPHAAEVFLQTFVFEAEEDANVEEDYGVVGIPHYSHKHVPSWCIFD